MECDSECYTEQVPPCICRISFKEPEKVFSHLQSSRSLSARRLPFFLSQSQCSLCSPQAEASERKRFLLIEPKSRGKKLLRHTRKGEGQVPKYTRSAPSTRVYILEGISLRQRENVVPCHARAMRGKKQNRPDVVYSAARSCLRSRTAERGGGQEGAVQLWGKRGLEEQDAIGRQQTRCEERRGNTKGEKRRGYKCGRFSW